MTFNFSHLVTSVCLPFVQKKACITKEAKEGSGTQKKDSHTTHQEGGSQVAPSQRLRSEEHTTTTTKERGGKETPFEWLGGTGQHQRNGMGSNARTGNHKGWNGKDKDKKIALLPQSVVEHARIFFFSMKFPSKRQYPLSIEQNCSVHREVFHTLFAFTELLSLTISKVSSSKSSAHLIVEKTMHRLFTDPISLQNMLMDCPLALQKMLSAPRFVLKLPYSKIVVVGITGCPDPGQTSRNLQCFAVSASF